MPFREFDHETVDHGGQPRTAMTIKCSECGAKGYFVQSGKRGLPGKAAEQYFRNHGWIIGKAPRADRCQDCSKKKRPDLKVVTTKEDEARADEPRKMTPADRRIVTEKLDDVYDEKALRYSSPWSDHAVSKDLGIPRAWVEEVREQFFGPSGSNEEFDDFLEKAAPIISEAKDLSKAARAHLDQAKALTAKAADLEKRIGEIERIGKRIEREAGL